METPYMTLHAYIARQDHPDTEKDFRFSRRRHGLPWVGTSLDRPDMDPPENPFGAVQGR